MFASRIYLSFCSIYVFMAS